MNDRVVTGLGALAALLVLAVLLFQGSPGLRAGSPTSAETGPNGYAGLWRWLATEGIRVESLRQRAGVLADGALAVPATGNLLITTLPHRMRLRLDERLALQRWIAGGNSLLVMAALNDRPDWSLLGNGYLLEDLTNLTGLDFATTDEQTNGDPEDAEAGEEGDGGGLSLASRPVRAAALEAHPLMHAVGTLEGTSRLRSQRWEARWDEPEDRALLVLAREPDAGAAALWQLRQGGGHVIVSAIGSPLTNGSLGKAGNAAFVANLVRYHVAPGAAVIFDDLHQGLSALYDPDAFFSDVRLWRTLGFLLGFWALYLLGTGHRLAPLVGRRPAPSQTDFVAAVGGLLARKLSPVETGRLMIRRWREELETRDLTWPGAADPWEALAAVPALERETLAAFTDYDRALGRGEAVDLRRLHDTLEELRRMLR